MASKMTSRIFGKKKRSRANGSNVNVPNPLVSAVMLETNSNISALTKHQMMNAYLGNGNVEPSPQLRNMLKRTSKDAEFKKRSLAKAYAQQMRANPKSRFNLTGAPKGMRNYHDTYDKFMLSTLTGVPLNSNKTPNKAYKNYVAKQTANRIDYHDYFLHFEETIRQILDEIVGTNEKLSTLKEQIVRAIEEAINAKNNMDERLMEYFEHIGYLEEIQTKYVNIEEEEEEETFNALGNDITYTEETLKTVVQPVVDQLIEIKEQILSLLRSFISEVEVVKETGKNKKRHTRYESQFEMVNEYVHYDFERLLSSVLLKKEKIENYKLALTEQLNKLKNAQKEKERVEQKINLLKILNETVKESRGRLNKLRTQITTNSSNNASDDEGKGGAEEKKDGVEPSEENKGVENEAGGDEVEGDKNNVANVANMNSTELAKKFKKVKESYEKAVLVYSTIFTTQMNIKAQITAIEDIIRGTQFNDILEEFYQTVTENLKTYKAELPPTKMTAEEIFGTVQRKYLKIKTLFDETIGFNSNRTSANAVKIVGKITRHNKFYARKIQQLEEYEETIAENLRTVYEYQKIMKKQKSMDEIDSEDTLNIYITHLTAFLLRLSTLFEESKTIVKENAPEIVKDIRVKYYKKSKTNVISKDRRRDIYNFATSFVKENLEPMFTSFSQKRDDIQQRLNKLMEEKQKYTQIKESLISLENSIYYSINVRNEQIENWYKSFKSIYEETLIKRRRKYTLLRSEYNENSQEYVRQAIDNIEKFKQKAKELRGKISSLQLGLKNELLEKLRAMIEDVNNKSNEIDGYKTYFEKTLRFLKERLDNFVANEGIINIDKRHKNRANRARRKRGEGEGASEHKDGVIPHGNSEHSEGEGEDVEDSDNDVAAKRIQSVVRGRRNRIRASRLREEKNRRRREENRKRIEKNRARGAYENNESEPLSSSDNDSNSEGKGVEDSYNDDAAAAEPKGNTRPRNWLNKAGKNSAAKKIQAVARGHRNRSKVSQLKDEANRRMREENRRRRNDEERKRAEESMRRRDEEKKKAIRNIAQTLSKQTRGKIGNSPGNQEMTNMSSVSTRSRRNSNSSIGAAAGPPTPSERVVRGRRTGRAAAVPQKNNNISSNSSSNEDNSNNNYDFYNDEEMNETKKETVRQALKKLRDTPAGESVMMTTRGDGKDEEIQPDRKPTLMNRLKRRFLPATEPKHKKQTEPLLRGMKKRNQSDVGAAGEYTSPSSRPTSRKQVKPKSPRQRTSGDKKRTKKNSANSRQPIQTRRGRRGRETRAQFRTRMTQEKKAIQQLVDNEGITEENARKKLEENKKQRRLERQAKNEDKRKALANRKEAARKAQENKEIEEQELRKNIETKAAIRARKAARGGPQGKGRTSRRRRRMSTRGGPGGPPSSSQRGGKPKTSTKQKSKSKIAKIIAKIKSDKKLPAKTKKERIQRLLRLFE